MKLSNLPLIAFMCSVLLTCAPAQLASERRDVSGAMAAKTFHEACFGQMQPSTSDSYYLDGGYWQNKTYDLRFANGEVCQMYMGSSTPYSQFYQAMRAEIPQGGYTIYPVAQGGAGQLANRNYYLVSKL